jgi:hypothetical protein
VLRLSIVIPVLGNPKQLDDTLISVLENRPSDCEVIVVHNRPYGDPYHLADEVQFLSAPRKAGFMECVNLGLAVCHAPILHVLTCGVEVQPGWSEAALRHFGDSEIAGVASLVVDRDDARRVLSAGLNYCTEGVVQRVGQDDSPEAVAAESEAFRGPDPLAGFYRTSAVRDAGGFPTWTHPIFGATETAMSLRQAGFHCVAEPASLAVTGKAASRVGRGFGHGCHAERFFWRWASEHGPIRSTLLHTALVAGECAVGFWRPMMLLQLLGRACGLLFAVLAKRPATEQPAVTQNADEASPILAMPQANEPIQNRSSHRAA